jgi:hypothetical protein
MDPKTYNRLWDVTYEARLDTKLHRSLRNKHPIVAKWLADDARKSDPAVNPLHFLHRPYFRSPTRQRRLRIFNTLLWALKGESFFLEGLPDKNIVVGLGRHRTKFSIVEGTDPPQRATSDSWRKPNGHLSCQMDARLPKGIETNWEDEPGRPLETRIPHILASFAVWAAERSRQETSPRSRPDISLTSVL